MSTTIDEFLEPGADELHHILDRKLRSSSGRYDVVGQPELWQAFHSTRISSSVEMRASLGKRITPGWQAWIPDLARIIYSERQLESLYNCTLITRVNIALDNTIRSGEPRITIINCGASFDSDVSGSTVATILPDWIVIEGTFSPHDANPPDLEELKSHGMIVAVGDTKLFQWQPTTRARKEESEDRKSVVEGTHSCHPGWLAQVQHYAHTLRTRFGFVLTNKELVLAQFLREDEASPRVQRGLRSSTLPDQLHRGLPSDFKSSDAPGSDDRGGHDEQLLRTPQPRQKRRHESGDSGTLPPSSPPTGLPPPYNLPRSSPVSVLEERIGARTRGRNSQAIPPSPSAAGLPPSSPNQTTSPEQHPPSSISEFIPSEREFNIGRVLVRSYRIPNSCDEESPDRQGEEEDRLHPAKALFAFLMLAYSVGWEGRKIGEEEVWF